MKSTKIITILLFCTLSLLARDRDMYGSIAVEKFDGKYVFSIKSGGANIRSWVLRIDNLKGESIKTFSGGNVVPSSILWDGLAADGLIADESVMLVKLAIMGKKGVIESNIVEIELK